MSMINWYESKFWEIQTTQVELTLTLRRVLLLFSDGEFTRAPSYSSVSLIENTAIRSQWVNRQITKTQAFALFSSSFTTTKDWKIKLFPYPVGGTARTSWFKSKPFTVVTCHSFTWNRTFAVAWKFLTTSEIQASACLPCWFPTACAVWLTSSCQILNFRWNLIHHAIL